MKLNLPSWATTAIALLAGIAQILNQLTFDFVQPWRAGLTIGLVFVAGLGISPLIGPQFRQALHLSHTVTTVITSAVVAATLAVETITMNHDVKAIIMAVLTVLAGLGFGSIGQVVPVAPVPAPVPPAPPAA